MSQGGFFNYVSKTEANLMKMLKWDDAVTWGKPTRIRPELLSSQIPTNCFRHNETVCLGEGFSDEACRRSKDRQIGWKRSNVRMQNRSAQFFQSNSSDCFSVIMKQYVLEKVFQFRQADEAQVCKSAKCCQNWASNANRSKFFYLGKVLVTIHVFQENGTMSGNFINFT